MASECGEVEYESPHFIGRNPEYSLHVHAVLASHHRKEASKAFTPAWKDKSKQQTKRQTDFGERWALPDSISLYDFNISNLSPARNSGYWPSSWGKNWCPEGRSVFLGTRPFTQNTPLILG